VFALLFDRVLWGVAEEVVVEYGWWTKHCGGVAVDSRGGLQGKWGMGAVVVGVILFVILFANHLLPSEGFFVLLFHHCIKLAIDPK